MKKGFEKGRLKMVRGEETARTSGLMNRKARLHNLSGMVHTEQH